MTPVSLQVVLQLFKLYSISGELHPSWKHSIVLPFPKAHKPSHLPSSYRPISLTSHVCKLMEKVVGQRLKLYLEYHSLLHLKQSGFRARRRTTDHILRLHDAVQKAFANKHNVLAVFIHIEKAYDMVNKTVLVSKLLKLSINGEKCGVSFSRSFLDDFGSSFPGVKVSANGHPQRSILSPILFSIMINDISCHVFSPSALYADDLLFWERSGDIKLLEERCQESLSKVAAWCISSGFLISPPKSAAVLLETWKRKPLSVRLALTHVLIPLKKEYKYLGVTFQSNGMYTANIQYVVDKCHKRLNMMRFLKGTSWGARKSPLLAIYRCLVPSILECGMEAYFFFARSHVDPLVKIQN